MAVHCAQGDAICANAQAVKFGQTTPVAHRGRRTACRPNRAATPATRHCSARGTSPRSSAAGTPNLTRNGYQVTDAAGNLVDLDGNAISEPFSAPARASPGFSPTATQSLAYLADMQEAGIPVTYGYISDLHERKAGTSGCTTATATGTGKPIGPGDSCYVDERQGLRRTRSRRSSSGSPRTASRRPTRCS